MKYTIPVSAEKNQLEGWHGRPFFFTRSSASMKKKGEPHAANAITGCNGWALMRSRIA